MNPRPSASTNGSRSTERPLELESVRNCVNRASAKVTATPDDIQLKPWKFIGYKGYSKFIDSDNDFLILRRFGTLSTRVALLLQDEISELEERLEACDLAYSSRDAKDVNNGTFRDDFPDRKELLQTIADRMSRYSKNHSFERNCSKQLKSICIQSLSSHHHR